MVIFVSPNPEDQNSKGPVQINEGNVDALSGNLSPHPPVSVKISDENIDEIHEEIDRTWSTAHVDPLPVFVPNAPSMAAIVSLRRQLQGGYPESTRAQIVQVLAPWMDPSLDESAPGFHVGLEQAIVDMGAAIAPMEDAHRKAAGQDVLRVLKNPSSPIFLRNAVQVFCAASLLQNFAHQELPNEELGKIIPAARGPA